MDPSCTIGFYAKGQHEFESLRSEVQQVCKCFGPLLQKIVSFPPFLLQQVLLFITSSSLFLPKALSASAEKYPMFVFEKGKGRGEDEDEDSSGAPTNFTYIQRNLKLTSQDNADDSLDEFVLIWTKIDEASPEGPATPKNHRWMCHSGICSVYKGTMSSEGAAANSKDFTKLEMHFFWFGAAMYSLVINDFYTETSYDEWNQIF